MKTLQLTAISILIKALQTLSAIYVVRILGDGEGITALVVTFTIFLFIYIVFYLVPNKSYLNYARAGVVIFLIALLFLARIHSSLLLIIVFFSIWFYLYLNMEDFLIMNVNRVFPTFKIISILFTLLSVLIIYFSDSPDNTTISVTIVFIYLVEYLSNIQVKKLYEYQSSAIFGNVPVFMGIIFATSAIALSYMQINSSSQSTEGLLLILSVFYFTGISIIYNWINLLILHQLPQKLSYTHPG